MKDRELIIKTAAAILAGGIVGDNFNVSYREATKAAIKLIKSVDLELQGPTWRIGETDED
jgi:hypothetical protein